MVVCIIQVLQLTSGLEKCLLVIGKLQSLQEVHAAKKLVSALGWPTIVDVLSGLRIGQEENSNMIFYADHVLVDREEIWTALKPDAVLQLGGHLTSKRLGAFLVSDIVISWHILTINQGLWVTQFMWKIQEASSTSATKGPMTWIHVSQNPYRDDPAHLMTHKIECSIQDLVPNAIYDLTQDSDLGSTYVKTWKTLDKAVERSINLALDHRAENIVEPLVARIVSDNLPAGNGLFLGNSMPIRDMDMYSSSSNNAGPIMVAANRGASGIDGVLSTAIGKGSVNLCVSALLFPSHSIEKAQKGEFYL